MYRVFLCVSLTFIFFSCVYYYFILQIVCARDCKKNTCLQNFKKKNIKGVTKLGMTTRLVVRPEDMENQPDNVFAGHHERYRPVAQSSVIDLEVGTSAMGLLTTCETWFIENIKFDNGLTFMKIKDYVVVPSTHNELIYYSHVGKTQSQVHADFLAFKNDWLEDLSNFNMEEEKFRVRTSSTSSSTTTSTSSNNQVSATTPWVCCSTCKKWREVPEGLTGNFEGDWVCTESTWRTSLTCEDPCDGCGKKDCICPTD